VGHSATNFWGQKRENSTPFRTNLDFDREYLLKESRHQQFENTYSKEKKNR